MRRYIATRRLTGIELLGRVSEDDKNRAFVTADIYCSPATGQESFGIVLLEAMAAGTAIVCSDIHGYKGVVRRGEQALLVPPKDVGALAGALGTLLRNPEMRVRMGASGRERAKQFSWESITAKVDDYYGFVIRRLAAQGALPPGYHAPIPPAPRGHPTIRTGGPGEPRRGGILPVYRRVTGQPPAAVVGSDGLRQVRLRLAQATGFVAAEPVRRHAIATSPPGASVIARIAIAGPVMELVPGASLFTANQKS